MYLNEQSQVNEYDGKQESLKERLSQIESGNTLLRQHLHDVSCNEAKDKEELVLTIENYRDIIKKLEADSEKQGQRNKELIDECKHLQERMDQYEDEKVKRKLQEAQDRYSDLLRQAAKMEDHLQMLEVENATSKIIIKEQVDEIEQLQKILSSKV
ncbi:ankyrin repeat domain-containing protein 26-like [Suricata suricatta]|uniref:ankyrin repeat domain-containing protein 26-like n=1 Tax=Suricata suricatta TaxID=37032 RepID=UPI001155D2CA|nr:ankyrin repeat domain-containing protein 26-like [Suricata suricatta]